MCVSKSRLVLILLVLNWLRKWREVFQQTTWRSKAKRNEFRHSVKNHYCILFVVCETNRFIIYLEENVVVFNFRARAHFRFSSSLERVLVL